MVRSGLKVGFSAVMVMAALAIIAPAAAEAAAADPSGYWLLGGDGGVFAFDTVFAGSAAADPALCPPNTKDRAEPDGTCWSLAATPDGGGYWILNGDTGAIHSYGTAAFFGDPAARSAGVSREFLPNGRSIVATPSGRGYWVLEAGLSGLGSVLAFGDAPFLGDTVTAGVSHDGEPVAMAASRDGRGYWIVDSDGGVFNFGDAGFFGSLGGTRLAKPIVGIAPTPSGRGYYLTAADGGVFTFGDAVFAGSTGGVRLAKPVVGIAADPAGQGYWLAAADGGVFSFGGAPFRGSLGATHLSRPIFAIASTPGVATVSGTAP